MMSLSVAGCSFDSSALEDRAPCVRNSDCLGGVCLEGNCYYSDTNVTPDSGPLPDSGDDSGPTPDAGDTGQDTDSSDDTTLPPDAGDTGNDTGDDVTEPTICTPREGVCTGQDAVVCNSDGTGYITTDCTQADACEGDSGCTCLGGACVSRNCTPGTRICDSGNVHICSPDGQGYTLHEACGDDVVCRGGACLTPDCTPNTDYCSGNTLLHCSGDGLPELTRDCNADGLVCEQNGRNIGCVPRVCDPASTACTIDGRSYQVCNDTGSAYLTDIIACGAQEQCVGGTCIPAICTPNQVRCVNDRTIGTCNALGSVETTQACSETSTCVVSGPAAPATCVPRICTPGAQQCNGVTGVPERCNTNGTTWEPLTACAALTTCVGGNCVPQICTPEQTRCGSTGAPERCNANGTAWVAQAACPSGNICIDGTCTAQICVPGESVCAGNLRQICNDDGTALIDLETCPGACTAGACEVPICGDRIVQIERGETCDDGNNTACDACESCNTLLHYQFVNTTTLLAAPAYDVGTSNFTIEGWVYPVDNNVNFFGVGSTTSNDYLYVATQDGRLFAEFKFANNVDALRAEMPGTLENNRWHHISASRSAGRGLLLFVNGVPVGSNWSPGTGTPSLDSEEVGLWIATDGNRPTGRAFVDEVRFSNLTRYNSPFTPQRTLGRDSNTVAYFPLNDISTGPSGTLLDASGNTRNIRLSNGSMRNDNCLGEANKHVCGDGQRAHWERCDDGNNIDGDGCSSTCQVEQACPGGTRMPGGSCYVPRTTGQSYENAREACQELGGDLLQVDSFAEQVFVRSQVLPSSSSQVYWIGINDRANEGQYRWNSSTTPPSFLFWGNNEPGNSDCGNISLSGNSLGTWRMSTCNNNFRGLCELP